MDSFEVARLAGVSRSTVSRVVNGYSNVSEETRKKVMEVIEEHGYIPNVAGRNLVGTKVNIIGLFILNYKEPTKNIIQTSPFFTEFLSNITDYLQQVNYRLIISMIYQEEQLQSIEDMFVSMQISGGIIIGDLMPKAYLKGISERKANVILVNQYEELEENNIMLLNTANYKAAFQVVEVLIRKGHKRILHLAGPLEKASTLGRYQGYRDCLAKHGLLEEERMIEVDNIHLEDEGYKATKKYFLSLTKETPTALFACNDLLAIGGMRALKELGYKIPKDISVVGHDNTEISRYVSPTLSTVALHIDELVQKTVSLLIENEEGDNMNVRYNSEEFEILMRESVGDLEELS